MRKLFVSIAVSLCAVPFLASSACSSSSVDCTAKNCPNDAPPAQASIDACKKQSNTCSGACSGYTSCYKSHQSETCGADGKTDTTKLLMVVTSTCMPSADCTKCVQGG